MTDEFNSIHHALERYFDIKVLSTGVYYVLKRNGLNRLPNGKVERSHKTDKQEFWQLIDYTDDIDIKAKLKEWEIYYNCHRPHRALAGKTQFEIPKEKHYHENFIDRSSFLKKTLAEELLLSEND